MTQERSIRFKIRIPCWGCLQWFKKHNLYLSLSIFQGFKVGCAKGLCLHNVETFYNLQQVYDLHNYTTSKIWNCDEYNACVSYKAGSFALAKVGSKLVHSIFPNEQEWLLMSSYINAHGESIPNFYIFKGK
jgi:hypothetical protein